MKKRVKDWLEWTEEQFIRADIYYGHGTDNAWDEAVQLVLHALKLPVDSGQEVLERVVETEAANHIQNLVEQRLSQRKPLPYLTKQAWFAGLSFYVDERVLIPRSPFGEWIERRFVPWIEAENVTRILDIGTGSGCMAIIAALAFPEARVDAVDVSADALAVAKINVQHYELENRVRLIQSDCFSALGEEDRYDIIMSNPPYVGAEEMSTLPEEYYHEPRSALEAADEGFAIVDRIIQDAKKHLTPQGILVIEVGNNSELLLERYPEIPFVELELERGGQGVFLIEATNLEI